jgi:transcriptional regulator with XRE-family HTH domain
MRTIAARLEWARKRTGLSQRGLAKLADLSERHVGLIEDGTRDNPELKTLQALAKVLGLTVGWLSSGEGEQPTAEDVRAAVAAAEAAKGAA